MSRDLGRRRGVFHPLDEKSVRIKRTASIVNCSRQKGQTGESRGEVFSTILLQQPAHNTWPLWGIVSDVFFLSDLGKISGKMTHHKVLCEEGTEKRIPLRIRRNTSLEEVLA